MNPVNLNHIIKLPGRSSSKYKNIVDLTSEEELQNYRLYNALKGFSNKAGISLTNNFIVDLSTGKYKPTEIN